jgi:N-acetyl-gamma-glutamyl-phosphate reductase
MAHGMRVVDLSGAWRLREAQNRAVYGFHDENAVTAADLMEKAVYGLPELNGDRLPGAALVANPGCYATSVILALAPLLAADMVDREKGIISDSKSGVSGAGKEATARHPLRFGGGQSFRLRGLRAPPCGRNSRAVETGLRRVDLYAAPAAIPRGILSTIYVHLKQETKSSEVESCFKEFYEGKPWVRVFATPKLPEIQFSLHTNYCDLGFCLAKDGRRLVLVSCIDNLLKGAAGQAVQNMNLMYGFREQEGLQ